jgi:hypothetical protein
VLYTTCEEIPLPEGHCSCIDRRCVWNDCRE